MNDQVKYSLAGFCMGVAELIPGISGATIAVIFRIYPNLMKILSNIRVKNITLNLSSLSQTFQFNVSLPLILSMIIAIIFCSKGVNFLLINFEDLFLLSLGLLMIALSFYIVQYFKDALIDKKLFLFLFLGIGIGFLLQGLNIGSGNISMVTVMNAERIARLLFDVIASSSVHDPPSFEPCLQTACRSRALLLSTFVMWSLTP